MRRGAPRNDASPATSPRADALAPTSVEAAAAVQREMASDRDPSFGGSEGMGASISRASEAAATAAGGGPPEDDRLAESLGRVSGSGSGADAAFVRPNGVAPQPAAERPDHASAAAAGRPERFPPAATARRPERFPPAAAAPPDLVLGGAEPPDRVPAADPPARTEHDGPIRDGAACTPAQMRRFIKSRAWIPMHELRRRFAIDGIEDDVTPVRTGAGPIFVGLPEREAQMLGELLRSGDVGYELSLDPRSPIVIGVYPMRPVTRG